MPVTVEGKEFGSNKTYPDDTWLWVRVFISTLPQLPKGKNLEAFEPAMIKDFPGQRGYAIDCGAHVQPDGLRISKTVQTPYRGGLAVNKALTLWVPNSHLAKDGLTAILKVEEKEFLVRLKAPAAPPSPYSTRPWAI